jgi:hypothetical protein
MFAALAMLFSACWNCAVELRLFDGPLGETFSKSKVPLTDFKDSNEDVIRSHQLRAYQSLGEIL